MKKYLKVSLAFLLLFSFPLIMIFGQDLARGVRIGLQLSYRSVLPALFPAAVVCGILAEILELLPLPINHSLWVIAQLCGFPLGIKALCRAYQRGLIEKKTAVALSFCSSNASPAFLILYVGGVLFGDLSIGVALFVCQCLISFLIALFNGAFLPCRRTEPQATSLFTIWGNGISNATLGCLGLTGYICLFSAICAPIERFEWFRYLHGFLELTAGISKVGIDHLLLCGAMIGFSGVSVFLQNASVLSQMQLPILPVLYGKLLYGLLMPLILFLWLKNRLILLLLLAFLICFDKYRKTRYNTFIPHKKRSYL